MSDLDFEELDKAVNKIVNKSSVAPRPELSTTNGAHITPTVAPKTNIVKQSRGQFMDMVHPAVAKNGQEATTSRLTESSAYPARKTINRLHGDVIGPPKMTTSPTQPVSPQTPVPASAPKIEVPVVKNDWPDPIDAAASASLFLPDAKVEKRPLGGLPTASPSPLAPVANPTPNPDVPDINPAPPKPEATPHADVFDEHDAPSAEPTHENNPDLILPPELGADLVAIEESEPLETKTSSFSEFATEAKAKSHPPKTDQDLAEFGYIETTPALPKEQTLAQPEAKKAELAGFLAAGSIPQQYKTAPLESEPDKDAHPMFFDADHYADQQTTRKEKRKTTPFQWIFIVVGLLLLGATLGAAAFVFVNAN